MTAISLRPARTTASDRLLIELGIGLVRLGRARTRRREAASTRQRAIEAALLRRHDDELGMLAVLGARR